MNPQCRLRGHPPLIPAGLGPARTAPRACLGALSPNLALPHIGAWSPACQLPRPRGGCTPRPVRRGPPPTARSAEGQKPAGVIGSLMRLCVELETQTLVEPADLGALCPEA